MNRPLWGWRIIVLMLVTLALGGTRAAGAQFDPVELVAVALVTSTLWWLSTDLANQLYVARWEGAPSRSQMNRGRDFRLAYLTRLLGEDDLRAAHGVLLGIVDRILLSRYGVARASQPGRAREVLGDRLYDFLVHAPVHSPYDYHRRLPDALARLEEL